MQQKLRSAHRKVELGHRWQRRRLSSVAWCLLFSWSCCSAVDFFESNIDQDVRNVKVLKRADIFHALNRSMLFDIGHLLPPILGFSPIPRLPWSNIDAGQPPPSTGLHERFHERFHPFRGAAPSTSHLRAATSARRRAAVETAEWRGAPWSRIQRLY